MTEAQFADLIRAAARRSTSRPRSNGTYMQSNLRFLREAEARQVGPAVLVLRGPRRRGRDGRGPHPAVRQRGQSLVTALIFDCDGVLADTERFGHLPAFNQMFSGVRRAGPMVRGGVRREAADRRAARSGWRACSRDGFVSEAGLPTDAEAQADLSPHGTGARPRSTPRSSPRAQLPDAPGHRADHRGGARCGLDAGGRIDLSRGVGAAVLEHAVGAEQAARFTPSSPATSWPGRSRRPTSTSWLSSLIGAEPAEGVVDRGLAATDCSRRRRRPACVVTVSGYTEDEDFDEAALVVSLARRPGRRDHARAVATAAAWTSDHCVRLDDLEACIAASTCTRT